MNNRGEVGLVKARTKNINPETSINIADIRIRVGFFWLLVIEAPNE